MVAAATESVPWQRAARLADLEGDGPHALSAAGQDLVAVRVRGALKVFDGRCPHQGALLGEGELEGHTLVCRNHRWKFDRETGQRVGGRQCLKACPTEERDGELFVDLRGLASATGEGEAGNLRRPQDLPGPRGIPVLGNALQVDDKHLHLQLEAWSRQYGRVYYLRLGPRPVIVVADPPLTEAVLRARPDTYRRVSLVERVFEEMSLAGVFSAEGDAWRAQRRLAMEALSQRHLRGFYPNVAVVATRLVRRWEKAADAGTVLDLAEELKRFTVDITTQLVFGHDIDTLGKDDDHEDAIQRDLEVFFPAFHRRLNALVPYWRWFRLPADYRIDRAIASIHRWIAKRVEIARTRLAADPAIALAPTNFLEAMLVARDTEGRPFSDDVIFGNALTMLLAGEDTTAYTIAWAVHHLCEDARVVEALRAEVDPLLGEHLVPRDLEQAGELPYVAAVANESMRLRPVAPMQFVEPLRDVVVGDVAVPKGMTIIVLSRPPVLEPARFEEPQTFLPERWIPGARSGPHDAAAHIPFGSGPRICPGRSLALLEMRVVLASLYRNFDVERASPASEVEEISAFTMMPVGLRVRLRRRQVG
ncbi:MAG TPA: cytochrome P450 [Labilithrix sp.]|nr:cytochrome P450 [Labilithrix sp.]